MMSDPSVYARHEAKADWERARKAANLEGILSVFTSQSRDLIPFDEVQRQLRLSQKNYRGLEDIPLDKIRGSVGRYQDFTASFLPRHEAMRDRWQRVDAVGMTTGLPPIEAYLVGDAYFVVDGNHRVSVARQNRSDTIQAYVWEFATPVGLSSEADIDEVFIKAEYSDFLEKTTLNNLRPEQNIEFTTPGRYRTLLEQIHWYQQVIEQIDGEPCSWDEAVTAWYDMFYTPSIQIINDQNTLDRFPGRTEADLFIWTWRYRDELREHGEDTHLAHVAAKMTGEGIRGRLRRVLNTIASWFS